MKNLSAPMRVMLSENFTLDSAVAEGTEGGNNTARKMLAKLQDGECVEEVLLGDAGRQTVCISCQAGCRFKCSFCASGQAGFKRNLETGEMIGQFLLAARETENRISNLVFMGMGEPFDNYDAVLKAIRIINNQDGISLGARKITISTCGIIPGIQRLMTENLQVELSVSLHAPNDELRSSLMPVNTKYPVHDLISACKDYSRITKRIITFEYTLINGVNDTTLHAQQLVKLLSKLQCRINLIPLSKVEEYKASPSDSKNAQTFMGILNNAGINSTFRYSQGSSIKAACGQLRYRKTA